MLPVPKEVKDKRTKKKKNANEKQLQKSTSMAQGHEKRLNRKKKKMIKMV